MRIAMFRFFLIAIATVVCAPMSAQTYLTGGTGSPTFNTALPVELGFVDLSNGNLHLEVPLATHAQRGGLPLAEKMVYDSRIWTIVGTQYSPSNVPNSTGGWRFVAGAQGGTAGVEYVTTQRCDDNIHITDNYTFFRWTSPDGTQREFPIVTHRDTINCMETDTPTGDAAANDSSGYHMWVTNYTTVSQVLAPDGTQVYPALKDTNGNYFSADGSGNLIDTLGRTPVTKSVSGATTTYAVLAPQGATVNYTVTTASINISALFNNPNAGNYSGTMTVVTQIGLPNGLSYQFGYDSYGGISSITLPTGGQVTYGYSNYTDSYGNENRWVTSRSAAGGTWSFTPQVISTCATGAQNCQQQVMLQKPTNDKVVYTFTMNGGAWNSTEQFQNASGATLETVSQNYDLGNTCSNCIGAAYVRTITTQTALPNGFTNQQTYAYDSIVNGNVTSKKEWDYYAGGFPALPDRETDISYLNLSSYTSANILNRPNSVTIKGLANGAQFTAAQTVYCYDGNSATGSGCPTGVAIAGTSGVVQHDYTNYPATNTVRGNVTAILQWLNTTNTWLTTSNNFDDLGNVLLTTDPGGHQTSFAYSNANAYVSQVTLPATGITGSVTHIVSSTYDANTGLVATSVDQNGQTTSYQYDTMLRPTFTYFNGALQTEIQYWDASGQLWTWNYLDASNHTDFRQHIDSMGRMDRTAFLNQEGSWDMQDTCFDSSGRPAFTSYTYQDASGWGDASRCSGLGDAIAYDGLNRPVTVTHSDGSTVQYAYSGRATKITDEGNGSATVSRILQSDGLGRLQYVCEVSGTTLLGSGGTPASCGLDYSPASGFLTTYKYDTLNNLVHVDQGSLAVRTYVYDSLSRLTQENTPEQFTSTISYTYDNDSLLHTRLRPAPNNAPGNITTNYAYDQMHRLTGVTYTNDPTGTPSSTYNYDETAAWQQTLTNSKGRMTSAYAGGIPGIAASLFSYDSMGRPTQNWQCTPRTCGTAAYYLPYSYDQLGDVTSAGNGVNATYTNSYNPAGRLTGITSSLSDANHPGTLLSNAHYGPFGPVSDTLGNGLNEAYAYHPRGWLQNATFGGVAASGGTGSVSFSGAEQSVQVLTQNATAGSSAVTVNGDERSTQVLAQSATYSTGTVSISGTEQRVNPGDCPGTTACYVYDSGTATITVNGVSASANYGQGSSSGSIATGLANAVNGNGSMPVTASASGNVVTLTSKSPGSGANYGYSSGISYDDTDFTRPSFTSSDAGSAMTGGANAVYNTVYDTGTVTVTVNGYAQSASYGQSSSTTSLAGALASAFNNAGAASPVTASSSGNVLSLYSKATGSASNYSLSSSYGTNSGYFTGSSFSTSNAGALTGGADAVYSTVYDSGTASITVNGHADSVNWGQNDSPTTIAANLAAAIHNDSGAPADASASGTTVNLTARATGPASDYSFSAAVGHTPTGNFPNSSFTDSTSGSALVNGSNGVPAVYSYALGFAPDGSITTGNDSANGNWSYGYDEFNRLTSSNKNSGAQTFTYAYDRLGNRWQQNAPQGGPAPQYTFDTNNHIQAGSGISYDTLGNIVNDGLGNTYTWDAENRLVSINSGARTYIYDPLGRRVAEKQNGTLIAEFLYDLAGNKLSSFDGSGNAVAEEIYAGGRHLATYLTSTNSTYFHHTNWLGTLRADSGVNGASSQTCTGLPFGDGTNCTGTFSSANLFTDAFHDAEDNLEHTLFRKLSTTQGRWMSPDPAGMAAVVLTNPQTLNMYAYVGNTPINFLDLLGLWCSADAGGKDTPCNPGNSGGGGGSGSFGGYNPFGLLDLGNNNPVPVIVGSMSTGNCDGCSINLVAWIPDLSALNLFTDSLFPFDPPDPGRPSQCQNVTSASLDYGKLNAQTHIESVHMVFLPNGGGNSLRRNAATGAPASQYFFSPAGTAAENWNLVKGINAFTFDSAVPTSSRGNLVFTATIGPENIPLPGARPYIGLEGLPSGIVPRFQNTNQNTLVTLSDCQTVVTSHPGKP